MVKTTMYVIPSIEILPEDIVLNHGVFTHMHRVQVTECRAGTRATLCSYSGCGVE